MAPQNQRNLLAMILSGGGRGDPYANQASGPFASSPRVYGGQSPAAGPPQAAVPVPTPRPASGANVPVPTPRPKQGGGGGSKRGGGNQKKAAGGQFDLPLAKDATSPSSLMQSPELNATSPSSLMQNPPTTTYPTIAEDQDAGYMPSRPPSPIPHYPTIAEDQPAGPPYQTIASDQPWGLPQPTPPHSMVQRYPTIASDQTGFPPGQPARPYSPTPPEARLGLGRPGPRSTGVSPGGQIAMYGQPHDFTKYDAARQQRSAFSWLDPSTW
jgi:hypothetical protein